jgi:hypothetical protein
MLHTSFWLRPTLNKTNKNEKNISDPKNTKKNTQWSPLKSPTLNLVTFIVIDFNCSRSLCFSMT